MLWLLKAVEDISVYNDTYSYAELGTRVLAIYKIYQQLLLLSSLSS